MDQINQKIRLLLTEINDRTRNLSGMAFPQIEVDILLEKLRQLYQEVEKLKQGRADHQEVVMEEPEEGTSDEPDFPEEDASTPFIPPVIAIPETEDKATLDTVVNDPAEEEPIPPPPPLAPEPPLDVSNPLAEIDNEPSGHQAVDQPVEIVHSPMPVAEKPTEFSFPESRHKPHRPSDSQPDLFGAPSIGDKLKSDVPSLNDKITGTKNDFSLADQVHLKPISDLKTTIGINEKFQFANELFDGSTELYNAAINQLNNCAGSWEASNIMMELQQRYGWESDNPIFAKLKEYVTRRYM